MRARLTSIMLAAALSGFALCVAPAVLAQTRFAQTKQQPAARRPSIRKPTLPREKIAADNFGADAPWFLNRIPFLEIDDPQIQQIYYYRWKLFRSHVREIGPQGTTVLEFLENVPWARQPYTDLNDSASFHILEARWLRDPAIVDDLIDHLYSGGGNDRHFSESIAAATEASTWVTGDPEPALRNLEAMQRIFNQWDDHFDRTRNLYWIEPLLDATEYTISSIDASGAGFTLQPSADQNHNGFTGGYAFRPSINSYQYGNALAIARLANLAKQPQVAADYRQRAEKLRAAVLSQLWNPALEHFTDRYQRSTQYVTANDFLRGRELVGYLPWFYELPPKQISGGPGYAAAWRHMVSSTELAGPFGLRTVEPSYPRYLTQYRYDQPTGPECQWNGPSWPFQTSQALTAMANLLDDYPGAGVTREDYLRLLRQYTHQHFLSSGNPEFRHPDLQEDYNPETGQPIVGLARSHHYFHSTYVDLILSGLVGIRPRADQMLEIDPLLPTEWAADARPIRYFAVENVAYHGHDLGVVYDFDGSRYGIGKGLTVFVDGRRVSGPGPLGRVLVPIAANHREASVSATKSSTVTARGTRRSPNRVDLAVNVGPQKFAPEPTLGDPTLADRDAPIASASSTATPSGIAEAVDGRLWFFPENPNGWSPSPSLPNKIAPSWYAVDFRKSVTLGSLELYFFADTEKYRAPAAFQLQYETAAGWRDIPAQTRSPKRPLANGANCISFPSLSTQRIRIVFTMSTSTDAAVLPQFRLIELKAFAP